MQDFIGEPGYLLDHSQSQLLLAERLLYPAS